MSYSIIIVPHAIIHLIYEENKDTKFTSHANKIKVWRKALVSGKVKRLYNPHTYTMEYMFEKPGCKTYPQ